MARIEHVYWKDKIGGKLGRQVTEAFRYGFTVGPHGEWEMLIAKEDAKVKKDVTVNIKIEEVEVPSNAIVLPCPIIRHALGIVASIVFTGAPMSIEERRTLKEVIFLPVADGKVGKGELLCVVNVFYTFVERRLARGNAEKWLRERYRH